MISLSHLSFLQKALPPLSSVAILLISAYCLQAQENEQSTYDKIWDKVVLYENEENSSDPVSFGSREGFRVNIIVLKMKYLQHLIMMIMIGEGFDSVLKQHFGET